MGYYSVIRTDAVIDVESVEDAFAKVSAYFTEQKDHIGYWLYVEENDESEIAIYSHGESGKAYEWEHELSDLLSFVAVLGGKLNGVFYREGEENTDIERFIIQDNVITGQELAKIVFSDGEVYGSR